MSHLNTLDSGRAVLAIVDMQEAFRGAIASFDELAARITVAARGAGVLGVPLLVTEQYPKGLGHTAPEVLAALPPDTPIIEKTAFSSCGAASFVERLKAMRRDQVLLCGIEAHVCINQTAHDLLADGLQVHLLLDAIGSRSGRDREAGLAKMQRSGAIPSCVELALFELMRDSRHGCFKQIQKLVK